MSESIGTIYDLHALKVERDNAIKERDELREQVEYLKSRPKDAMESAARILEILDEIKKLREKLKVAREALYKISRIDETSRARLENEFHPGTTRHRSPVLPMQRPRQIENKLGRSSDLDQVPEMWWDWKALPKSRRVSRT